MKRYVTAVMAAAVLGAPATSLAQGNLAAPPAEVVTLAITGANANLSATSFEFVTGEYYRLNITSDGLAEVQFAATTFFNNVWVNQVVAGGVEIRMWGNTFKAIEVGEGGPMEVSVFFVPVRPGEHQFTFVGDAPAGTGGTFVIR
ncbi:MAG: hypothetical protein KIT43_00185 [Bauldia sp.]|nr:hypothetical protein [Bauldia sp.]MCW5718014.1 hypothetical protein [Bauldia sp.]